MTDNQRDPLLEIEGDLLKPISVNLDGDDDKSGKAKTPSDSDTDGGKKQPAQEDENVAALRRQLAAEQRQRQQLEARNRENEQHRLAAEAQTAEGQVRLLTTSLETAQADRARAKTDLAKAMSDGDWAKATDLQELLNDAQIRVDHLTRGKDEMERRAEAEKAQRERQPRQDQIQHADPVEALIVNASLSRKSADWLRSNPECVTDQRKNRMMIRAHEDAEDEGIVADTPEYFAFIEKRVGIGHSDDGERQRERQAQRRDPASSTAAPVSRGSNGDGRGSRQNTVTLSPAQRQFCDESGIKYEDYARQMVELKKEGRLQ